jgi:hypothetical protein
MEVIHQLLAVLDQQELVGEAAPRERLPGEDAVILVVVGRSGW